MRPWDIVGDDGNVWKNFEDKSPKGYTFQESTIEFKLSFLPVKRDNYIIIQSCTSSNRIEINTDKSKFA